MSPLAPPAPPDPASSVAAGRPAADAFQLSWPQLVLALGERMRPGTVLDPRCSVQRAFAFAAEPDLARLGRALSRVVARHDGARTLPVRDPGGGLRAEPRPARPARVHVRRLPEPSSAAAVRAAVSAAAYAPHDLEHGPLVRLTWLRGDRGGVLVLSIHHWAGDFGALDALQAELSAFYASQDGREPPDPPRYADVARRPGSREGVDAGSMRWWQEHLAGARRSGLPVTRPGARRELVTHRVSAPLATATHDALLELAGAHRATPFMVLLAALSGLLEGRRDAAGDRDLLVFATDPGRAGAARGVLGFLAEPVALRYRVPGGGSLAQAVGPVRDAALTALGRPRPPFLRLLGDAPRLAVTLLRGPRPATLVQSFALRELELGELTGTPLPTFEPAADGAPHPSLVPIDLDITLERHGSGHTVAFLYDPGLWTAGEIGEALARLEEMLQEAVVAAGASRPDSRGRPRP